MGVVSPFPWLTSFPRWVAEYSRYPENGLVILVPWRPPAHICRFAMIVSVFHTSAWLFTCICACFHPMAPCCSRFTRSNTCSACGGGIKHLCGSREHLPSVINLSTLCGRVFELLNMQMITRCSSVSSDEEYAGVMSYLRPLHLPCAINVCSLGGNRVCGSRSAIG